MVVDAVSLLDPQLLDISLVGIKKVPGGSTTDSFLVKGVAFKKTFSYAGFEQMPKSFTNPKILLLNVELELKVREEEEEEEEEGEEGEGGRILPPTQPLANSSSFILTVSFLLYPLNPPTHHYRARRTTRKSESMTLMDTRPLSTLVRTEAVHSNHHHPPPPPPPPRRWYVQKQFIPTTTTTTSSSSSSTTLVRTEAVHSNHHHHHHLLLLLLLHYLPIVHRKREKRVTHPTHPLSPLYRMANYL